MTQAFFEAGVPREAISIYPGAADVGAAVLSHSQRSLIFGGTTTVEQYAGNPNVQVHGPGFSKIIFGDDIVDDWEQHLDLMVDSILSNSGRGCINCSGVWASRHTRKIASALADRLSSVRPLPPEDPEAALAAFTVPGQAKAISADIDSIIEESGVADITAPFCGGSRLIEQKHCDYLCPTVLHCESPDKGAAKREYMFPFVSVVQCPQERMLSSIGPTLVATAITENDVFRHDLIDARNIDRLNLGPVPTIRLNWLQPHEGNIVDFLYRPRAFQMVS
jgi:acyl-CoA reductase-like NAD-dependent aldehyde dehydrogenase